MVTAPRRLTTVLTLLLVASQAAAAGLSVGDNAPKVVVKDFAKGGFEAGTTYVVAFWATWSTPCWIDLIHLNELQKEFKEVAFIAVSVLERDQAAAKPYVESMGERLNCPVALDKLDADGRAEHGHMAKTWLQAAGQEVLPTAFVINDRGQVAWIGSPMNLANPLKQIMAGEWDLQAAAAQFKVDQARNDQVRELQTKLAKLEKSSPNEALSSIDQAVGIDPQMEKSLGLQKLRLLVGKNAAEGATYGHHLVEKVFPNDPSTLNALAWSIVGSNAPKPNPALVKTAIEAAQRADDLTSKKSGAIADTLAKAYFDNGQTRKAVETQERAIVLARGTHQEKAPGLTLRLEQYKKALK
jgi:thiol-disulfide isomerase/thioredoxin